MKFSLFQKSATPLGDISYNKRHEKRNMKRVAAILDNATPGELALDIGCNAGYFSRGLLSSGLAKHVDAIEYDENIVPDNLKSHPEFSLYPGDATDFEFSKQYHTTVYGAVHHHIFAHHGYARAMEFWIDVVNHTESAIFMESGQLAEGSRWYWQRALATYYSTDEQYYGDLIYAVGSRLKSVSLIDTHWLHGVRRWLLKIELWPSDRDGGLDLPNIADISVKETLYRTIGSRRQQLLREEDAKAEKLYRGVVFNTGDLRDGTAVFCKRYVATKKETFEGRIAQQIDDARFIRPVAHSEQYGLIFPYIDLTKFSDISAADIENKLVYRRELEALFEFARNKRIEIDFGGRQTLALIDIIDLHASNLFLDQKGQNIFVFDLEFYSMANRTRNEVHLRRMLCHLDNSIQNRLALLGAQSKRARWLLKMALARPEQRLLYRVEDGFSWLYIKIREQLDRIVGRVLPGYWQ